jgi:hypothetical protein
MARIDRAADGIRSLMGMFGFEQIACLGAAAT